MPTIGAPAAVDSLPPLRGWARALLLVGVLLLSLVSHRILGLGDVIPWPIFAAIFPLLLMMAWRTLSFANHSPLLPFLCLFFIFFTVFLDSYLSRSFGLNLRLNSLTFVLAVAFTGVYFLRHPGFFWSRPEVKLAMAFFLLTLFYYFFHSSDFVITPYRYVYALLISPGMEIKSPPARTISLVSALGLLVSAILAMAPFMPDRKRKNTSLIPDLNGLMRILAVLLGAILCLMTLCVMANGAKLNYGMHVYLPVIQIMGTVMLFLLARHHDGALWKDYRLSIFGFLGIGLLAVSLILPLMLNKTSLIGMVLSILLFLMLSRKTTLLKTVCSRVPFRMQGRASQIVTILVGALVILALSVSGVFGLFANKIDYVVSGITNPSSLRVRQGNWHYFFQDWEQTLDVSRIVFGYGIGQSRETMFFISAMRDLPKNRNLVQTVHNVYIEYAYDYGLMCLLYFALYGIFIGRLIRDLRRKGASEEIVVISAAQAAIIFFPAFYGLTDGLRVQLLIQLFMLLGFLERLKPEYQSAQPLVPSIR